MPRVLLLVPTTTYRTHAFMEAARRVGVEVTVASEQANALAKLNPTGLLTLKFRNPQQAARQVVEFAAQHPIDAVVAVDDQVTLVGAAICQALSLRHNSMPAVLAARNKQTCVNCSIAPAFRNPDTDSPRSPTISPAWRTRSTIPA